MITYKESNTNLISSYLDLYRKCFNNYNKNIAYLNWLYKENPMGNYIGIDAHHDNKIIGQIGLSGSAKKYFECLVEYQNSRDSSKREALFQTLISIKSKSLSSYEAKAQLDFFSEWYHTAIYEMIHSKDFIRRF